MCLWIRGSEESVSDLSLPFFPLLSCSFLRFCLLTLIHISCGRVLVSLVVSLCGLVCRSLIPTLIPYFCGSNESSRAEQISAGPSCSTVVDRRGTYYVSAVKFRRARIFHLRCAEHAIFSLLPAPSRHCTPLRCSLSPVQMAGKFKHTGDGSSGSPYTTFKFFQELLGRRTRGISTGANSHLVIVDAPKEEGGEEGAVMAIGFGQKCENYELGCGVEVPKNSSKPRRIEGLNGLELIGLVDTPLFLPALFTCFGWE